MVPVVKLNKTITKEFISKITLTVIPACLESFLKKDAGQASMTELFKERDLIYGFNNNINAEEGVTLVEVMIALLVALVVFLALMQTALVGIDSNIRNILRDEAVGVAADKMDEARNLSFSSLGLSPASPAVSVVRRQVRNLKDPSSTTQDIPFTVTTRVDELDGDTVFGTDDANNKQVNVVVNWQWKGDPYSHSITTIRKR
jgi:type II secretory pathway pseudopilin PulG